MLELKYHVCIPTLLPLAAHAREIPINELILETHANSHSFPPHFLKKLCMESIQTNQQTQKQTKNSIIHKYED